MEIKEFTDQLKKCKRTTVMTGQENIRLMTNPKRTTWSLIKETQCKTCGHTTTTCIEVTFNKPHKWTIFEAGLIYLMYAENKRPYDYTNYHKCQAGKEFIQTIQRITLLCGGMRKDG